MTGRTYRTRTGRVLTDEEIERLADEVATTEYPPQGLRRRGRPPLGDGPSEVVPVRLDPALRAAVGERAARDETTVSEVIRAALRRYIDAA